MIIACENNGEHLAENEGFAHLIIPTDKYISDRAVKRVNRIEVRYGQNKIKE